VLNGFTGSRYGPETRSCEKSNDNETYVYKYEHLNHEYVDIVV
jgi:hypothetical protein